MSEVGKVRELNDAFRSTLQGGKVIATRGVIHRPDLPALVHKVKGFADFTEANDPYGEHDFGSFSHDGSQFFWKIDYYDKDLRMGSPDPADPTRTTRVLTLMLAEEY